MKFEYNKEKFAELGLIVKHGNCNNIVFFWNENDEAVSYNLEIYRIGWQYKNEGAFEEIGIVNSEAEVYDMNGRRKVANQRLSKQCPAIIENSYAVEREWKEGYGSRPTLRYEVLKYDFNFAFPVCTINIERNKFYHSINDLPCGDYIVCLKLENRSGEIFAESVPYYFHIDDAEKRADDRASGIARAAAPHYIGSNINGNW